MRERRRQKQRQMMIRKYTKLGLSLAAVILAVVFVVRGIIMPIMHKGSGGSTENVTLDTGGTEVNIADAGSTSQTTDEDGGVTTEVETDTSASYLAVRVPVKGQSDVEKTAYLTPGWHDTSEGRWYQNPDGSYYASGFQQIDGVQYSFDDKGYLQTGWVTAGASEYYFNDDGSYNPEKKKPMLCLTFDDGPGQYTMDLLNCLEENGAHATFFMLGQCAELYPDEIKKMVEIGCQVGNHSYDHEQMTNLSLDAVYEQFSRTDSIIQEICGQVPQVTRMPYGAGNEDIYATLDRPAILWSLDSLDWSYRDVDMDYDAIMNGDLTDGSIILMHDIHPESVEAAKRVIPDLVAAGYRLVTISEMAEAKNVTLQNVMYTDFWQSSINNGLVPGYNGESDLLGGGPAAAAVTDSSGDGELSDDSSEEELSDDSYDDSEEYSEESE